MKMDGLSFPEAVRAVAQKAGIALPKREFSSPEEARLYGEAAGLRRQLIDIHEAATQYFQAQLKSPEAARAREYLSGRGVSAGNRQDLPHRLRAGRLQRHARRARAPLQRRGHARLRPVQRERPGQRRTRRQMYARFRKRITFPIANEQGKVIAFTARALDTTDDKGREVAKYLNSPETALYTKGNVLFNLDKAKSAMRANDFGLLVEGQMDCISVYMAGIHNVRCHLGTAFTEAQVRLLGRFTTPRHRQLRS